MTVAVLYVGLLRRPCSARSEHWSAFSDLVNPRLPVPLLGYSHRLVVALLLGSLQHKRLVVSKVSVKAAIEPQRSSDAEVSA